MFGWFGSGWLGMLLVEALAVGSQRLGGLFELAQPLGLLHLLLHALPSDAAGLLDFL